VGFPSPETHLAESDEVVRRIAHNVPPPWIIKLRFTTGGRGMALVKDADELVEKCRTTRARHGAPMIQDYIPGQQNESSYLVLDRDRRVVSALTVRIRRHCNMSSAVNERVRNRPNGPFVRIALAQHINWWGGVTVQHKVDPRDGQPKLMEINPRLGINLWYRTELGINVPLMCLQIARGEKPKTEAASNYPHGYLLLKPFEDFISSLDLIGLPPIALPTCWSAMA
jgi:predicted ATP-grasp superfamily ATP-dependent carboligase